MAQTMHYWVGSTTGYIMSTSKNCPIKTPIDRLKYMGYTEDIGWPKKMNTGRILYKPIGRKISAQKKKLRKKSQTDTESTK